MKKLIKVLLPLLVICCLGVSIIGCGPVKIIFNVSFPAETVGYTLVGENEVAQGDSYSFAFALTEGYEKTDAFAVKVNDNAVELDAEGKATVENVSDDLVITVEGVERISYAISLAQGNGYTLSGAESVYYGEDYALSFELAEGYKAGEGFALKVNGEAIELTDGSATVSAVKSDLEITVEGVERISYAISLAQGNGYTLSGAESVYYGEDYALSFELAEGYKAGEGFALKVNGEAIELTDGSATISAVKSNLEITVEGVEMITYAVTLPAANKYYTVSGETVVNYGANYEFTVVIAEGYEKTEAFAVKVNGAAVEVDVDGKVVIANVMENLAVTVEGIAAKTYDVTLVAGVGYTLEGELQTKHGASYELVLAIAKGYDKTDAFAVKVNGVAVEVSADGKVVIANVTEALVITVEGLEDISDRILEDGEFENQDQWWANNN